MSDLVGNPKDRFSQNEAHLKSPKNEESGSHKPYGIALLDNHRVIVTVPSAKVLQPITITPNVNLEEEMILRITPYDVVCRNRKLSVSTDDLNQWSVFSCGGI